MRNDLYLRTVLTVIAAALVYLCVAVTPFPAASAQGRVIGAPTPGMSTGPAEMVIVGWRVPADVVVPVRGNVSVAGDVTVKNVVRIDGRVQTEQAPNTLDRTVLVGWEDFGTPRTPGQLRTWNEATKQGLPVSSR